LLCSSSNSLAGVFERGWQTPGDGLLTYDDINNRQWLDLSLTILDQFPGSTREDQYQQVVAETLPGGVFEGFQVAKSSDVTALAESAGIDTSTSDYLLNGNATSGLINLLGETVSYTNGRRLAIGFIDEISTGAFPARVASILDFDPPSPLNNP